MVGILCRSRMLAFIVVGGSLLQAQGLTGTLFVSVKDVKGSPLAGVRVEVKSDRLMIPRIGFTDENGLFRAPLLAPGSYVATASKDGFVSGGLGAKVPLGASVTGEAVLRPMVIPSTVVQATAGLGKLGKTEVGMSENFRSFDMERLPIQNDLDSIARLAPFVTVNTAGNTVIAGAASYENKFLVNGTDVNDPYFSQCNPLYIEDALEETQVLSHCVSAEHGRFSGGVVNAITRRGGNVFSGSFRSTWTNSAWNATKPFQKNAEIRNHLNQVYTATFGGPILKDRLWFFFAGRTTRSDETRVLPYSGIQYSRPFDQKRWELSLTYQPHMDHRLGYSHIGFLEKARNTPSLHEEGATPDTLRNMKSPFGLTSLTYDWIINPNLNLSLLATEKRQRMECSPIKRGMQFQDSPIFDQNGYLHNNTYFGFSPEDRNNRNFKAVFTGFMDFHGSHELKTGYEFFEEKNTVKNEQSPTGYIIFSSGSNYIPGGDWKNVQFKFDENSHMVDCRQAPGGTFRSRYHSLFINDNWLINSHFNASIGLRYEGWKGDRRAGYKGPGIMSLMPRLGLNYDPFGDGSWQFAAAYAQYSSKINAAIAQSGTYVGNPIEYHYKFLPGPGATGMKPEDYAKMPFAVKNAPLTVVMDKHLKAPVAHEYTLQMKHRVGDSGVLTLMGLRRDYRDMFEDFVGLDGTVVVQGKDISILRWGNTGALAERNYTALMAGYEDAVSLLGGRLSYQGNLTLSRLYGNYEADNANLPGGGSPLGNYPKAFVGSAPKGRLAADEPVRVKLFGAWTRPVTATGDITLSARLDYASGRPYSRTQKIIIDQNVPGYVDAIGQAYTKFYGSRGCGRYPSSYTSDIAVEWSDKTGIGSLGYFAKFTIYNWLNHIQKATFDTSGQSGIKASSSAANVFTPSSTFGKALNPRNYLGNRMFELQAGVRF